MVKWDLASGMDHDIELHVDQSMCMAVIFLLLAWSSSWLSARYGPGHMTSTSHSLVQSLLTLGWTAWPIHSEMEDFKEPIELIN